MEIPAGEAGQYRLAQLDDYVRLPRSKFPSRPPLTLSLRARASDNSIPGTWGFGLWNDPFGMSLGFGGTPFRLPALPNAAWFFHASEENWLSFGEKSGNGFLAQAFRSPVFPFLRLARLGITFPFSRVKARHLLNDTVAEDGVRLSVDAAQWHRYRLEWSPTRSAFWVDDALALETSASPRPPLGLVIWIDNQFAAFTPEGKIGFGVLAGKEEWLEVEEIVISEKKEER